MDTSTRNGAGRTSPRSATSLPIPNLIDVQRRSYERFLQMNLLPDERANQGLQAVFTSDLPVLRLPRDLLAGLRQVLDRRLAVQVRRAARGSNTCA